MRLFLAAVSCLLLLTSCGERCNARLYIPILTFELPQAAAASVEQGPCEVRTCINTTCWAGTANPDERGWIAWDANTRRLGVEQRHFIDGGMNGENTIVYGAPMSRVSLSVSRDAGALFSHEWNQVTFDSGRTPGSMCGGLETSAVLTF